MTGLARRLLPPANLEISSKRRARHPLRGSLGAHKFDGRLTNFEIPRVCWRFWASIRRSHSTIKVIPQNIPVSVTFGTFVSAVRKRPRSASLAAMITKEIAFIPIEANMLLPALRAQCNE
jgi:hypothetical protein